jgi:hypothetical protein
MSSAGLPFALAEIVVAILIAIAAIHVHGALGGRWGKGSAIPTIAVHPVFRPGPVATLIVAIALLIAADLVAQRIGLVSPMLPAILARIATALVAVVFLGRSAISAMSGSSSVSGDRASHASIRSSISRCVFFSPSPSALLRSEARGKISA